MKPDVDPVAVRADEAHGQHALPRQDQMRAAADEDGGARHGQGVDRAGQVAEIVVHLKDFFPNSRATIRRSCRDRVRRRTDRLLIQLRFAAHMFQDLAVATRS